MTNLPGVAQEIADVIGRERALYLIGQLPRCVAGAEGHKSSRVIMYVPRVERLMDSHQLVRILGRADAERLCAAFGTENLQPPTCQAIVKQWNHRAIRDLYSTGLHKRVVAEIVGMSLRRVDQVLASDTPSAK